MIEPRLEAARQRVILALDVPTLESARDLVKELAGFVGKIKVGLELADAVGQPQCLRALYMLTGSSLGVFLDKKWKDIPNTVAGAARQAVRPGVDMVTVHIDGGLEMMQAVVNTMGQAAQALDLPTPMVLGVSLLSSLSESDLRNLGIEDPARYISKLLGLADEAGLQGLIVQSDHLKRVKERFGNRFVLVTPGIRRAGDDVHDHASSATPKMAILNGADYLVVGRSLTGASNKRDAALAILEEVQAGVEATC